MLGGVERMNLNSILASEHDRVSWRVVDEPPLDVVSLASRSSGMNVMKYSVCVGDVVIRRDEFLKRLS
jgi:hypothetical protein